MNRSNNNKTVRKYQLINWLFTFLLCIVAVIGVAFFDKASLSELPGTLKVFLFLTPIYFIGTLPVYFINLQMVKLVISLRMSNVLKYILVNTVSIVVAGIIVFFYFFFTADMGSLIFMLCGGIYLAVFAVNGLLWNWFTVYKGGGKPVVKPLE